MNEKSWSILKWIRYFYHYIQSVTQYQYGEFIVQLTIYVFFIFHFFEQLSNKYYSIIPKYTSIYISVLFYFVALTYFEFFYDFKNREKEFGTIAFSEEFRILIKIILFIIFISIIFTSVYIIKIIE